MREVKRSALVPYTAEQMFALVEDIERYPQFLPWVAAAQLLERTPQAIVGRLEMHRAGMREIVTTRNVLTPPREITLALVAGPFKTLEGRWTFEPIGEDRGTRVSLSIRFEFANSMLNLLLSRSFEKSCNELVDAFVVRARAVYGTR
ncbi:MAG TPA: type II toxin-antitoxin system RatA family toxin [Steroidobacteraceae bacterium]|jgi:Oligoketide cyclase/lipid transport protein|nr:type II toxin-antitoxin system RatA family toxin [Steroidobacteraceae bacterium]